MRKLGRVLLWILGGAVLLASVVLLGVNLYVQSQGTHHRIQQELSQRLGTPLSLRRISVTPWSGLQLNGITIPQTSAKVSGDFLRAETFQLRVQFWSLFSDRLVIRQVSLIKPEVVWAQNAAGKWRLPELPPAPIASPAPGIADTVSSVAATTLPASPTPLRQPNEQRTVASEPAEPFTPEVRRVKLREGDFSFLDSAGRIVAKFSGLDFSSSFRTATELQGDTHIARISLRDRFFIEKLHAELHYDPAKLSLSKIEAEAAGGELKGNFGLQLQTVDSPFHATVNFSNLAAEKLMASAGGPPGMLTGRVEGSLDASGKTADSNALNGKGAIFLRDGQLQQYSLLVALGQILQIDELMQLHLDQAEVHFHISPGLVTIDQLLLRSPNIRLSAAGTINFEGKLHLQSQLALNEKVRGQLFAPIRENFLAVSDPPGYAAVDFQISGTVDRPKSDLMEKIVGHDLRDLGGVINSLFGHAKKKKPRPEPSPNESSSPSPVEAVAAPTVSASPTP